MRLLKENSLVPILVAGILTVGVGVLLASPFNNVYYDAPLYAAIFAVIGEIVDSIYQRRVVR